MKVIFSDLAIETLQEIVDFLDVNWTDKELLVMKKDIIDFHEKVQENYKIYPISEYDEKVRVALIGNKKVKILFENNQEEIYILLFWNNKGNPQKLINLLKKRI